jgi:hypothetical protein
MMGKTPPNGGGSFNRPRRASEVDREANATRMRRNSFTAADSMLGKPSSPGSNGSVDNQLLQQQGRQIAAVQQQMEALNAAQISFSAKLEKVSTLLEQLAKRAGEDDATA